MTMNSIDGDGIGVSLGAAEWRLPKALVERPGPAPGRERPLRMTVRTTSGVVDRGIDDQVSRLRRGIEEDPGSPRMTKSHRGGGYGPCAEVVSE